MKVSELFGQDGGILPVLLLLPLAVLMFLGSRSCSEQERAREEYRVEPLNIVVLKTDSNDRPLRCWKLRGVPRCNIEIKGSTAWWRDPVGGAEVRLAGRFNSVQVRNNDWAAAFRTLGITEEQCLELEAAP